MSRGILIKDEIISTPFYTAFLKLCNDNGKTPSAVASEAGISSGAPTAWKKGAIPKPAQRKKLCAYFGVSDAALLGYEDIKNPPGPKTDGLTDIQTEAMEFMRSLTEDQLRRFIAMGRAAFGKDGEK